MPQTQSKTGNVSRLLSQLNESATLAMARLSRELAQQGHPIVSLSLGEPDFNTPDFIKDAAKKAIDDNITHYPPVNGIPEVRKAIAAKFKRDNGLDYSPEQIVVSTGAKQAIANTIYALVNPGDEVIMPSPFWVSYAEMVRLVGGVPVMLPAPVEQDFKITPKQLADAIIKPVELVLVVCTSCQTASPFAVVS
ncbi:MAG: aminotransferase class I/II-fold pyridoxal phosphate-dependent enzyme [Flavobacteriales bacterium]